MHELSDSVQSLAARYGVRVTYMARGLAVVDVSPPCETGHAVAVVDRPGAVGAKMIRFKGDEILYSAVLDDTGAVLDGAGALRPLLLLRDAAVVIQRAFRRHRELAEPYLPVPRFTGGARTARAPSR